MTTDEQRIAIAQACGWSYIFRPSEFELLGKHEPESMGRDYLDVPNYLNDLNAMHEAEKILREKGVWLAYKEHLDLICFRAGPECDPYHATAVQRAEAFLRALNLYTP